VYEVLEDMGMDSTYESNDTLDTDPLAIGSVSIRPNLADSIEIRGSLEPAHMRIRLDDTWANEILQGGSSVFGSNDNFQSVLKGLKVTSESMESPDAGEIYNMWLESIYSRMIFYFHSDTEDSLDFIFVINDECARYSQFEHDASGTDLQLALDNPDEGANTLYIQGMAGAGVELNFPHLKEFAESNDVMLNKAEIILPITGERDFPEVSTMQIGAYDDDGDLVNIIDEFQLYWDGSLTAGKYTLNVTQYIQDILIAYDKNDDINYGLVLVPAGNSITPERVILYGPEGILDNAKLQITYTPIL
jgi:hypothetical protein